MGTVFCVAQENFKAYYELILSWNMTLPRTIRTSFPWKSELFCTLMNLL